MPASEIRLLERPSHTKIVATIGPASREPATLAALIRAGVDVCRLNAAHNDRPGLQALLDAVHTVAAELGQPVGVLVDLAGPKIRLGELPEGRLQCDVGDTVRFVRGESSSRPGELTTTYAALIDDLEVGDRVMLADGMVALSVVGRSADAVECRVDQGGLLRSRQGVNLPGVKLTIPAMDEEDRANAAWAARAGADFVGLSFVRAPEEVAELKAILAEHAPDPAARPHVVAKIEKPEALTHLAEIVAEADAVMVARGDLGVETDIAQVAIVQKRIIETAARFRRPVIIATQMLDSMQHSRLPTRAEVTDVANAILDGADACMLSGETAIGEYPIESVRMMHRIALATEPLLRERPPRLAALSDAESVNPITEATVLAASRLATELGASLVVIASSTGATALSMSKHRSFVPTVGVSHHLWALRRMALYWGVIPLPGAPVHEGKRLLAHVVDWGRRAGALGSGDRVVVVSGTGLTHSAHNRIVVHVVD